MKRTPNHSPELAEHLKKAMAAKREGHGDIQRAIATLRKAAFHYAALTDRASKKDVRSLAVWIARLEKMNTEMTDAIT